METQKPVNIQNAFDSIYNGIVAIDLRGKITYFNRTAERIFNIPSAEAQGRYILDVLPNTGGKLLEAVQSGKSFHGEKLKGQTVTLIANINPILEDREISGAISVFQDISEIESVTEELRLFKTMKNWLDTIIDSSYDGLWICDREGTVIRVNKASERINGVKSEEVVGKTMEELVAKGIFDKSVSMEVLKTNTSVTMIQKVRGEKRILVTGNPIFDDHGHVAFVVTNDRDISELDHLRHELQATQNLAKGYISKLSELEMRGVDFSQIVFRSAEMERIIEVALRVAVVDTTVLLLGESGVGKGMIAKLIHKYSGRNQGPFIRVDCAGIPDSLVESELFGYERGAFTGAKVEGKTGFFELANHGTLFLDEIGEIPLNIQSKLLRFLEDHEIVRVGGSKPIKVNVRVIAATNQNVEDLVASKAFREDLYYRLNVIPLHIPSLKERKEDIPLLIRFFLNKFNESHKKRKVLSSEVLEILFQHDYPGNIRELANFIERLVVTTENDMIECKELPKSMIESKEHAAVQGDASLKQALESFECVVIQQAKAKYRSQQEIAKALKVNQATISRKMKKYAISP